MFNAEIIFNLKRVGIEKHMWTSSCFRYELADGRNFKTFLKENYAVALDSCDWFTKLRKNVDHGTEHDVLIIPMDFTYTRHYCRLYSRFGRSLRRWWIWQSVSF